MIHDKNNIIINKVNLEDFISVLMSAYTSGADYIDLVLYKDKVQDQIGIVIRDYKKDEIPKNEKLTEDLINELLK